MLVEYDKRQPPKRRVLAHAASESAVVDAPGSDASAAERWAFIQRGA